MRPFLLSDICLLVCIGSALVLMVCAAIGVEPMNPILGWAGVVFFLSVGAGYLFATDNL